MKIKITQPLTDATVTPELVNEWYHQEIGIEAPIDATEFQVQGDRYGVNWLGVYVLALIDTSYFHAKHFKEKNSLMGDSKTFFGHPEAVRALTQQVGAYGGSECVKAQCPFSFVLPSTGTIRDSAMFGSHWYFQELTKDPKHFGKLYSKIQTYCLETAQPDPVPVVIEPAPTAAPKHEPTTQVGFQLMPLVRFALKTLWVLTLKFFPWLGWLSFVVYNLIDLLVK
jgi:hypothetical protein